MRIREIIMADETIHRSTRGLSSVLHGNEKSTIGRGKETKSGAQVLVIDKSVPVLYINTTDELGSKHLPCLSIDLYPENSCFVMETKKITWVTIFFNFFPKWQI